MSVAFPKGSSISMMGALGIHIVNDSSVLKGASRGVHGRRPQNFGTWGVVASFKEGRPWGLLVVGPLLHGAPFRISLRFGPGAC